MDEPPLPLLFAAHLARDRRRSAHTVRAYGATAVRLVAFLGGHWGEAVTREGLRRASAADLRAYLAHRRSGGLTNASAARELSAVRAFLIFAGDADGADIPRLRWPRSEEAHV